jgi:hypothetical protein
VLAPEELDSFIELTATEDRHRQGIAAGSTERDGSLSTPR